jgi:hypothetical protein
MNNKFILPLDPEPSFAEKLKQSVWEMWNQVKDLSDEDSDDISIIDLIKVYLGRKQYQNAFNTFIRACLEHGLTAQEIIAELRNDRDLQHNGAKKALDSLQRIQELFWAKYSSVKKYVDLVVDEERIYMVPKETFTGFFPASSRSDIEKMTYNGIVTGHIGWLIQEKEYEQAFAELVYHGMQGVNTQKIMKKLESHHNTAVTSAVGQFKKEFGYN